jgi:hypothetical protein
LRRSSTKAVCRHEQMGAATETGNPPAFAELDGGAPQSTSSAGAPQNMQNPAQAISSTASHGSPTTAVGVTPMKASTSQWRWDWSA